MYSKDSFHQNVNVHSKVYMHCIVVYELI